MGPDELQAEVARRYLGLDLPAWPGHPGREALDEEYSRVTTPERYRIVHARARLWADVLRGVPEVSTEPVAPDSPGARLEPFDRGVRLTSRRSGTLPLLLLERDAPLTEQEGTLPCLTIGVSPAVDALERVPDCGCDACDFGSADLLRCIDEEIAPVIGGPCVVLRGDGWQAQWHPGGGSCGGTSRATPDFDTAMDLCRRLAAGEDVPLPAGVAAQVGRSWFG